MFSVPENLINSSTAIVAQTGHGKSLLAAALIRDHLLSGRAVVTNMEIYYPADAQPFLLTRLPDVPTPDDMAFVHPGYISEDVDDKKNGLLVLDECSLILNSREWQSNVSIVQYFVNLRKHRYFLVSISQSFKSLDVSVRAGFSAKVFKTSVWSRFLGLHKATIYNNDSGQFDDKITRGVAESKLSSFFYLRGNSLKSYNTEQSFQVGKRQFDFLDLKHFPPVGNFGYLAKKEDGSVFYRVFDQGKVFHAKNWLYPLPADKSNKISFGPSHVLTFPKKKTQSDKPVKNSNIKSILFLLGAIYLVYWFFFTDSAPKKSSVTTKEQKVATSPVCDFFESMGPRTKELFKDDIFVSYMSAYEYDFTITNIHERFGSSGSPGFTVLFLKDKKVVDTISSFELELQGWKAYSWIHGVVLKKGTYAIFVQGDKIQKDSGGVVSSFFGGN